MIQNMTTLIILVFPLVYQNTDKKFYLQGYTI